MSFTIRQITQRADGGDIVRERRLDVAELSVGRGTDCDIQIADLGIMLRHARLRLLAPSRIAVEATGGVPLEIDGAFVNRAELTLAGGAVAIGLASHRLSLTTADDARVVITVERVAPAVDGAQAKDEARIFSLGGAMLPKRVLAWALVAAVLGLFLVWPLIGRMDAAVGPVTASAASQPLVQPATAHAFAPDALWTSGPLSRAHANLSNNCRACHTKDFVSVTDAACTACHKATPDHAALTRLNIARAAPAGFDGSAIAALHQKLNLPPGRCATCHKEHEGPDGALTVAENFCTDCHAGLNGRLSDTKLLNVADWGSSHPQFRPTIVTVPSLATPRFERISLDARPTENSGLKFPHKLHLSATNGVARMAREFNGAYGFKDALGCADCHTPDSDKVRFKPIEMERNCAMCHDLAFDRDGGVVRTLPHGKPEQVVGIMRDFYLAQALGRARPVVLRRAPGVAADSAASTTRVRTVAEAGQRTTAMVRAVFSRGGACFDCHAVVPPANPQSLAFTVAPVSLADHYLPKGRFPHGEHSATPCAECHKAATSSSSSDVLLPPIATCRSCHGNSKATQLVASSCETCHGFHYGEDGHGGDAVRGPVPGAISPVRKPVPVASAVAPPAG